MTHFLSFKSIFLFIFFGGCNESLICFFRRKVGLLIGTPSRSSGKENKTTTNWKRFHLHRRNDPNAPILHGDVTGTKDRISSSGEQRWIKNKPPPPTSSVGSLLTVFMEIVARLPRCSLVYRLSAEVFIVQINDRCCCWCRFSRIQTDLVARECVWIETGSEEEKGR